MPPPDGFAPPADGGPNRPVITRETRFGRARVQLDYRYQPDGSLRCITISPLSEGLDPGHALASLVETARSQVRPGHTPKVFTSALAPVDAERFLQAGFQVRSELALLTSSLSRGLRGGLRVFLRRRERTARSTTATGFRILRAPHDRVDETVDVDLAAFGAEWAMDLHDLRGALHATPSSRLHLATTDRGVVGFAITGRASRRGYLQRLAVLPTAQRQGIGDALVQASVDWAVARDVRRLIVNTQTTNDAALRLYERCGFVRSPFGLVLLEFPLTTPGPLLPVEPVTTPVPIEFHGPPAGDR